MISTGFFISLATRVRIRSHRSKIPFPSQGVNVWRLTLSDKGVVTATIQLFLLNSIARRHSTASSWAAVGGRLFHCPGFHQSLQCAGGEVGYRADNTFRPRACIGSVSLVSVNPEGSHDHPARDARALAQERLSALLALEI